MCSLKEIVLWNKREGREREKKKKKKLVVLMLLKKKMMMMTHFCLELMDLRRRDAEDDISQFPEK